MDMIQIYVQRLETTAGLIANIKTDQLGDPTPCANYDVRALVNHFAMWALSFAKGAQGEPPIDENTDFLAVAGENPKALADQLVQEARAGWSTPGAIDKTFPSGMQGNVALRIALAEAVIHGWDLAQGTHQSYAIPDQLAQPMLDGMKKMMGDRERPPGSAFGPEIDAPADASFADKLLAFTGRKP